MTAPELMSRPAAKPLIPIIVPSRLPTAIRSVTAFYPVIAGQTARLEDRGRIEIIRQNFGFDIENGIDEVELDTQEPHYYLEVRPITEE